MLFKCLLIQAKIHAQNWAGLTAMVEKLALHRLKPADFVDDRSDADYEPFQDQLLTAIHKSLKKHPDLHGEMRVRLFFPGWLGYQRPRI